MSLLLASQRYQTPIDHVELQNAFGDAGEWLQLVPELSALFYEEKGSLSDTFEFLSQVEGAEERLFPGYKIFESSLDGRVMTERKSLRGKLQREKFRALDGFLRHGREILENATSRPGLLDFGTELNVGVEAALLDSDHLAAIRLALKTKRLPVTAQDERLREDQTYPLHDRFSSGLSGIPLDKYYEPYRAEGGFPAQTIELVKFLIAHRSAYKDYTIFGINDPRQVEEFARLCGDENRLRALFVFTNADRIEWGSEKVQPARWFNIRELYTKAMKVFHPGLDPSKALAAAGYSAEEMDVLRDFGQDFYGGLYRRYANRFGPHLLRLAHDPEYKKCKVALLRDGASVMLGISAPDKRGLAATITGLLWRSGVGLSQAHLFSSSRHQLVMDFFHLEALNNPMPENLASFIESTVNLGLVVEEAVGEPPPPVQGLVTLTEWRENQYCLKYEGTENRDGLVFALTFKMFKLLQADIFGMNAYSTRKGVFISIYHHLPDDLSFEEASRIVDQFFIG